MNEDVRQSLAAFFQTAEMDTRITSTHISLFMVLYWAWCEAGCQCPFQITRQKIMKPAKLSIATYHKCMSELNRYGYITYLPSYNPFLGSNVYMHFSSCDLSSANTK